MYTKLNEICKNNLNNDFLKQYIGFKSKYPDTVVLVQIGTFFEALFEDAKILSDVLGITLASRKFKNTDEVLQAGIPKIVLNANIKKLLDNNIKVCICEEFKEDKKIKRKITRLYTKGTVIESEFLDTDENNYILALYIKENIGYLSYADISTGQFYKTFGDIDSILQEVDKISPNEVLITVKQKEKFKQIIEKYNTTILPLKYFESNKIENTIIKYCIETQKEFMPKLDDIVEYKITSSMQMDEITRQNLEITRTKRLLKKKGSMLWFLNYTKTPMGIRLLKRYINEPLLNIDLILQRQNAIKELLNDEKLHNEIIKALGEFCDLSRICARILNTSVLPKDLFLIVKSAEILEKLQSICEKLKSDLLKLDKYKLEETILLANKIKDALNPDARDELLAGGIIKDGYNSRLDYYRAQLCEKINILNKYEEKLKNKFECDKVKIGHNSILGYYIEFPSSKKNIVPENYVKKMELRTSLRFTNEKLSEYEQSINDLRYKINQFEYELYCELRYEVVDFASTIRALAKEIAILDVISSLATCARENNLVCPKINNENMLIVKNGYHPSLLKLNNQITKNDTEIKNGQMIIITGANMSGKSTYIKFNAIICLLAQIGSFVPAGYATCPLIDRIFMRQSVNDDIINNNSSFMVEMDDLKFILDYSTSSSLVLLDEPAKSTNAEEGGAIARAYCEYLLEHNKPMIFVATHNQELTKAELTNPSCIFNYKMGGNDSENAIIDRKLKRGTAKQSFAINTAELADLPTEIIRNSKIYTINNIKSKYKY